MLLPEDGRGVGVPEGWVAGKGDGRAPKSATDTGYPNLRSMDACADRELVKMDVHAVNPKQFLGVSSVSRDLKRTKGPELESTL